MFVPEERVFANRDRQEKFDRLADEFDIEVDSIAFGELILQVVKVRDPDSMLDDQQLLASHGEVEWQPYWAQAWGAAIALGQVLAVRSFHGQRILDLGCGLGITGAIAAARGGVVLLGDYAPPALRFAELNCWPWRERATVRRIDWKKDSLPERFDLIIGADILYDRGDVKYLDRFCREHLVAGGHFLHGDPERAMTIEFFERFVQLGWKVELERVSPRNNECHLRLAKLTPLSSGQ